MTNSQTLSQRTVVIRNKRGLHARASAKFVKLAEEFEAEIMVTRGDTTVHGTSIMGLMMLAAAPGSELQIAATGEDAEAALEAISDLIADRFGEED